ncbi:sensor histidine kinase [Sandaracinus amylolyticus]|uniref:histidine kinase n=1 Tax=Sandaracinus amylolyticus TaxID=927083 RepID=A0A0F6W7I3_9BACT|nr:ATP-binding protein [Sandaracinus amylolyticus]AKF09252.1 histidine kinase [Sandaracinus amylolyticus]
MTRAFDTLHAARLRAVGTRFLRQRPLVVAIGALGQAAILASSSAPRAQVIAIAAATGSMVIAFFVEAWALGRRALDERWLGISLGATAIAIGLGALLSGGLESPMLPLLFAPVTVGLAAFGPRRGAGVMIAIAISVLLVLAVVRGPFPVVPSPQRGWMVAWSTLMTLALARLGVVGLVEAYRSVGETLDRMRGDVLEEAAHRARESEALGAKVAHEIRNPLTAVKGLVQMLAKKPSDARDERRFAVVLEEVERMEAILHEYLTLARPLTDLAPEPLRPRALLDDVAAVIEARAAASSVEVRCEGDAGEVIADPRRLREALLNLAQNAVQAMPGGGVMTLRARRDGAQVRFEVHDTGEGFDPAVRAGEVFASAREGGTGLGLALARSVARQHGGTLEIGGERGKGAIVALVIEGATR